MADVLGVRVLGPVRLVAHGGSERIVRGHAARLLATLALEPGRAWNVDDLAARLWPEGPPATARTAIQGHVSRLRRALREVGDVRIETVAPGYTLHADRANVDATRFVDLVALARGDLADGNASAAVDRLRAAVALWSGAALGDAGAGGPLAADAAALEQARRDAEEHLADALIEAGDLPAALALAGRLVNDDPLREHRWWQLVVSLARSGRQADALRACRQATKVIVGRTGLDPGAELRRLEMAILAQDPSLDTRRWAPAPGSAPVPLVTLVGREEERTALTDRLHTTRMVTVVGPGGVGKSTLAIAVAADEAGRHADGAVVVDLADGGRDDVGRAIAVAVGAAGDATVAPGAGGTDEHVTRAVMAISGRDVLIVLDNCGDVADVAAGAAISLLRAGPDVDVLATSQVPLRVPGESVVTLRPLAVPRTDADPEAIRRSPAGELLAHRLGEQGCPILDDSGWEAVGTLARTLDGVPLALEIVAAAARNEPLGPLARRIAGDTAAVLDVAVMRPGRRRSLRAALDAAVARLDPPVAELFAAVGVLPGETGVDLAAALAGTEVGTARAALRTLADASLVVLDAGDRARARLLRPVRAYARGLLAPDTERAVLDRLACWCIDLAAELDAATRGPDQDAAIERFVEELPSLRIGLRHLIDTGRIAEAAVAFEGLVSCWADSAAGPEASRWADELLRHADQLDPGPRAHLGVAAVRCQFAFDMIADHLPVAERALEDAEDAGDLLMAAGARISVAIGLGWRAVDLDRSARLLDESRTMLLELGAAHWAAVALEFQGLHALRSLDVATGIARLEAALAEHRRVGAPGDIAHALTFIGFARRLLDDPAGARRAFDEARRLIARTRVATWLRATAGAGYAALALGDTAGAAAAFRDALRRATEVGDRRITSTALVGLASIARAEGDDQRTVALLLAAAGEALDGGDPADAVTSAVGLARMLSAGGHDDEAALLLGAARELPTSAGVRVHFGLAEDPAPVHRAVERHLGADHYAALAADGALIGLPAALARATERLVDTDPVHVGPGGLRLVG